MKGEQTDAGGGELCELENDGEKRAGGGKGREIQRRTKSCKERGR